MSVITEKPATEGGLVFDLVERVFLLALSLWAITRLAPAIVTEPQVMLLLISEGLAVAFILLRKPARRIDVTPYAAGVAFLGTSAPLLVTAPGGGWIPAGVGAGLMAAGLLLNIFAKIALNRSFGLAAANRGVKQAGPYRLLRHPMYAGYAFTQATFLLLNPSLWNLGVYALSWSVQLLRIRAEETLLLEDPAYRDYAGKVRFRLIPGVY
jgi:protein-S-isoprenylcysteine O-methyltransferase Ste14